MISCLRVLINEAGCIVDLVVDDDEEVFLAGVLGHFLVGDFLRHGD